MTPPAIPVATHPDTLAWRDMTSGTRLAVLRKLDNGGVICRIQGEPGSTFPLDTHWGGEEVYIISGDYPDASGTYTAGMYLSYQSESRHEPTTASGCDMIVIAWAGPPKAVE